MSNLTKLSSGQSAKVISIQGGIRFIQKLQNLGIREGVVIKKKEECLNSVR